MKFIVLLVHGSHMGYDVFVSGHVIHLVSQMNEPYTFIQYSVFGLWDIFIAYFVARRPDRGSNFQFIMFAHYP